LKAVVNDDSLGSCVVAIDEINLTPEPCTSMQEGRLSERFGLDFQQDMDEN
jgi:hypothetical protein